MSSAFSNSSVASPTSQFTLQPFFRFSYVTGSSLTSPGEPPMPNYVTKFSQNIVADTDKNKALIDCHKCSSSFLSIVKFHPLKIPASGLEKVRSGSCLKLFLIDCNSSVEPPMQIFQCTSQIVTTVRNPVFARNRFQEERDCKQL